MRQQLTLFVILLLTIAQTVFYPAPVSAQPSFSSFRYAFWLPYWRKTAGVAEATAHLASISELSPFGYTLKSDGSIVDSMKLNLEPWPILLQVATSSKIALLPSITSGNKSTIYNVLKNRSARLLHEAAIVSLVQANNFDGIDIDYENKSVQTRPYFSAFIKELSRALHAKQKLLSCSIEPRTPLNSLYKIPPKGRIERANDYGVIGTYCDEVRLMTYDQTTIDVTLNDKRGGGNLYAPIADVSWVHKVLTSALRSLPAKKIMLGVPTYGYEYEVVLIAGHLRKYNIVRSLSYVDALALAQKVGAVPERNLAHELSFHYASSSKAYLVDFSDAVSMRNIIDLAKSYNLRGVAIFKLDGSADPSFWGKL